MHFFNLLLNTYEDKMAILEQLRAKALELRKERHPLAPSVQFAIAEVEKIGKNAGNRATTEDEAIKAIQKIVATLKSNFEAQQSEMTANEIALYETFLPQLVAEAELRSFIMNVDSRIGKGAILKAVRQKYGALVDMKMATGIVDEILA